MSFASRQVARASVLLAIALLLGAGVAAAYPLVIDYTGFSYSQLQAGHNYFNSVGVIDEFMPGVGDPSQVYTYYLSGLALSSVQNLGGGRYVRTYTGGDFRIFESTGDSDRAYTFGINPPNPTAPASFADGRFWLGGQFSSFTLTLDTGTGLGTFSGSGAYYGGDYYSNLENNSLFTFAGLTKTQTAGIPAGYEYRIDGQLDANVTPVPEPASLLLLASALLGAGVVSRRRPR